MNNKRLSTLLNQAIVALQGCATELQKDECDCARLQREAEQKARNAAQKKAKRFCNCMEEFGPVFNPPVLPRPAQPRDALGRFVSTRTKCKCNEPLPQWGVTGFPPEDPNKRFGICVTVDEPVRRDFTSQQAFLNAHAKFDRLVDAAEACTWGTKATESTTLHKCNAIRKDVCDGPVFGVNLIGESHWF